MYSAHLFNYIVASRTFGTFAFAPTHKTHALAKAKEANFPNHRMTFVTTRNNYSRILTNINLKKFKTALLIEDEIIQI